MRLRNYVFALYACIKKMLLKRHLFFRNGKYYIICIQNTHTHTQCVLSTLVTFNVLQYNYVDNYAKVGNNSRAVI